MIMYLETVIDIFETLCSVDCNNSFALDPKDFFLFLKSLIALFVNSKIRLLRVSAINSVTIER